MRRWLLLLTFLIGVGLGVSGTLMGPGLAGRYLPRTIGGKAEVVTGEVVAKQREGDRLLLTVAAGQGAILAAFKKRVTEIDLLVEQGDTVTLRLSRYEPLVEDPPIERVKKPPRPGA